MEKKLVIEVYYLVCCTCWLMLQDTASVQAIASMPLSTDSTGESFKFDFTQRVLIIVLGVIALAIVSVFIWITVLAMCYYKSKKLMEESTKLLADTEEGNVKLVSVHSTDRKGHRDEEGFEKSVENTDKLMSSTHQEDITLGTFGFPEVTVEPISPPLEDGSGNDESTNVKRKEEEVAKPKEEENDTEATIAKETSDKGNPGEKNVTTDVPSENENSFKKESTAQKTEEDTVGTNTDGKPEPAPQVKPEGTLFNQIPILSNEDIEKALGIFIPELESENEITML